MSFLNDLINTLTGQRPKEAQQIPTGQAMTPQNIQALPQGLQAQAQIYNQNPRDPRVAGIDPAMLGYAPDNGIPPLNASQSGNIDSWNMNDPSAIYPPNDPRSRQPYPGPMTGMVNPLDQMRRGGTVYSPGEGLKTRY